MAGTDNAAGVHPCVGGVSERDHGDARGDSRAGSNHAKPRGEERFGGEPDAAVAGTAAARGGQDLQRPADQRGGAAVSAFGAADEGVAAGTRRAEPGAAATADSAAGRQFAARFANPTSAGGTASGRGFERDDGGASDRYGDDSEPQ